MAKVSNKLRGNGHWTSAYMPLQENLGGEVEKGVLTRRGASTAARVPTGRRRQREAEGVVEVAEEVVGEEHLGGAELAAGSAVWGNNRSELPPVRRSWRKTMAGKSRGPASLAGAAGRLLVQVGRGDEALLLAWSDSSERLVGDGKRRAMQRPTRSSAADSAAEQGRRKGGVGHGFLCDMDKTQSI
jgi:hypothetical protein